MVDIQRTIKIKYDINSPISYSNFIKNVNYESDMKLIDSLFITPDGYKYLGNFFRSGICIQLAEQIDAEFAFKLLDYTSLLFEYDIEETYSNLSEKESERLKTLLNDFGIKSDPLDRIQTYLSTANDIEIPTFLRPTHWGRYTADDKFLTRLGIISKDVIYNIEKIPNQSVYYTIFSLLILTEDIYLVYNGPRDIIVCSESNLLANISTSSVITNLSSFLKRGIADNEFTELKKGMKTIIQESDTPDMVFKKIIKYIKNHLSQFEKVEFFIGTKDQAPSFIEAIITQNDPKKFHETEQHFDTPPEIIQKPLPKNKVKRIYKGKKNISDL